MHKIKILYIIGSLGVGGCEKQLLEMCRRIDKSKYELSLIWYSPTPDSQEHAFGQAGVRTIFFDKFSMPLWRFFHNMRASIKKCAPDIVHTWLYSANFWGRWAALTCGFSRIIGSYRNEVTETNLIEIISEKLLAQRTLLVANSRAVACSLVKRFAVPAAHIQVIHNAVSLKPCDQGEARTEIRAELGLPEEHKIVLMVGRQDKKKNYALFIRTAQHVCRLRPDVTFVGLGRYMMLPELLGLAEQLGVADRVRFVDQRDDVHRWLAAADVFCLTSSSEGFPNVLLEAMLAGLPVVSTDFPAVQEIIVDRSLGIKVPVNDDKQMAAEIVRVLDDRTAARGLGSAARNFVAQEFTWDAVLQKMDRLYEHCLLQGTGTQQVDS